MTEVNKAQRISLRVQTCCRMTMVQCQVDSRTSDVTCGGSTVDKNSMQLKEEEQTYIGINVSSA